MTAFKHRAARCTHGFVKKLCVVRECPHWDGLRSPNDAARTVKHDAWGKKQPPRKRRDACASVAS